MAAPCCNTPTSINVSKTGVKCNLLPHYGRIREGRSFQFGPTHPHPSMTQTHGSSLVPYLPLGPTHPHPPTNQTQKPKFKGFLIRAVSSPWYYIPTPKPINSSCMNKIDVGSFIRGRYTFDQHIHSNHHQTWSTVF